MRRSRQQGFTLIECMAALGVMLIGAVGMVGLYTAGLRLNGDARRLTRATAIAQDLLNNIELWGYAEGGPLSKVSTTNVADIADALQGFETADDPLASGLADHGEATLTALGAGWLGIPQAALGGEYQRFWNVLYTDTDGDGVNDGVQIAVIVRWRQGGGWRRIVLQGLKLNPTRT